MSSAGALGLSFKRSAIFVFQVASCFSDSLLLGVKRLPVDLPFFMTSNILARAGVSFSVLVSPGLPLSDLKRADFFLDSVSHSISLWELNCCLRLSKLGVRLPSVQLASLPSEFLRLDLATSCSFPLNCPEVRAEGTPGTRSHCPSPRAAPHSPVRSSRHQPRRPCSLPLTAPQGSGGWSPGWSSR